MKLRTKPIVAIILLLSCLATTGARPTYHRCSVTIRRATPDELILELRSTSHANS